MPEEVRGQKRLLEVGPLPPPKKRLKNGTSPPPGEGASSAVLKHPHQPHAHQPLVKPPAPLGKSGSAERVVIVLSSDSEDDDVQVVMADPSKQTVHPNGRRAKNGATDKRLRMGGASASASPAPVASPFAKASASSSAGSGGTNLLANFLPKQPARASGGGAWEEEEGEDGEAAATVVQQLARERREKGAAKTVGQLANGAGRIVEQMTGLRRLVPPAPAHVAEDEQRGYTWFCKPPVVCLVCGSVVPRAAVAQHKAGCLYTAPFRALDASQSEARPLMELEVQAMQCTYFMLVLVTRDCTFADLDQLLRDTWLEPCCSDHRSEFTVWRDPTRKGAQVPKPTDREARAVCSMEDAAVSRFDAIPLHTEMYVVCNQPGAVVRYEMDDTVVLLRTQKWYLPQEWVDMSVTRARVAMRNATPEVPCSRCGARAETVRKQQASSMRVYDPARYFCSTACSQAAGVPADTLARLVNSPRAGTCSFPADDSYEDFSTQ